MEDDATVRHFDRLYKRIDELSERLTGLERKFYIGMGAVGSGVLLNLASNLSQLAQQ